MKNLSNVKHPMSPSIVSNFNRYLFMGMNFLTNNYWFQIVAILTLGL
jgi:hypothetical protein